MAAYNMTTYNPMSVLLNQNQQKTSGPYTTGAATTPNPMNPNNQSLVQSAAIRPTGSGPFDSAYRQNLATYAGGLMANPSGLLQFNPTDPNAFGAGPTQNQPNQLPQTLSQNALGGQPFNVNFPPPPPQSTPTPTQTATPSNSNYWKFWLQQFNNPMENTPQAY